MGPTLTIVRSSRGDHRSSHYSSSDRSLSEPQIFGGFAPSSFQPKSAGDSAADDSYYVNQSSSNFIPCAAWVFSLGSTEQPVVSKAIPSETSRGILHDPRYGPCFGSQSHSCLQAAVAMSPAARLTLRVAASGTAHHEARSRIAHEEAMPFVAGDSMNSGDE